MSEYAYAHTYYIIIEKRSNAMKCVYCDNSETKVVDSRRTDEGTIRRRRECLRCGKRFTTYEKVERMSLMVIKKDGRRERFDAEKIRSSIIKATEKRSVSSEEIDRAVEEIEKQVYNLMEREISSRIIGEFVMDALRTLDPVAYVRFASVYRQFADVQSFRNVVEKLLEEN